MRTYGQTKKFVAFREVAEKRLRKIFFFCFLQSGRSVYFITLNSSPTKAKQGRHSCRLFLRKTGSMTTQNTSNLPHRYSKIELRNEFAMLFTLEKVPRRIMVFILSSTSSSWFIRFVIASHKPTKNIIF